MHGFSELYSADIHRYGDAQIKWERKFFYYFRKCQTTSNKLLLAYYKWRFRRVKLDRHIEISYNTKIGKGLYLGHAFGISINPKTIIGNNCNINRGVLIGQENRGERKGTPIIGNNVWIGANSVIVGNIKIGDDVLIAPNSFVNCDIPPHSIVLGNPCIIKSRDRSE